MQLSGKVFVITGASSGIGEATAREAVKRGAKVAVIARRKDKLDALCKELNTSEQRAFAYSADVSVDGELERAVSEILAELGRIDFVLANAGFGITAAIDTQTVADYKRLYETNVFGVLRTLYATLPALKESRGVFAAVSSVAAYLALPTLSAYSMTKGSVRIFCEAASHELAPHGVAVTHIAPGFIASELRQLDNYGKPIAGAKDPVPQWLVMPSERAAQQIVRAMGKRRSELVLTGHGKFAVALQRTFPRAVDFFIGLSMKGTLAKLAKRSR